MIALAEQDITNMTTLWAIVGSIVTLVVCPAPDGAVPVLVFPPVGSWVRVVGIPDSSITVHS